MADDFDVNGFLDTGALEPMDQFDDIMFGAGLGAEEMFMTGDKGEELGYVQDVDGQIEEDLLKAASTNETNLGEENYGFDDAVDEMFGGARQYAQKVDNANVSEDLADVTSPSALKRKRSTESSLHDSERVAIDNSVGCAEPSRKEFKMGEIPASVLSDFTVEDAVEKRSRQTMVQEPSEDLPSTPAPRLWSLAVNEELSPECIQAELAKPVELPRSSEVSSALQAYHESLLRTDSFYRERGRIVIPRRMLVPAGKNFNYGLPTYLPKKTGSMV